MLFGVVDERFPEGETTSKYCMLQIGVIPLHYAHLALFFCPKPKLHLTS